VGLLGTRFTMEQDFYVGRLEGRHGLTVLTPPVEDREVGHRVIYDELVLGRIEENGVDDRQDVVDESLGRPAQLTNAAGPPHHTEAIRHPSSRSMATSPPSARSVTPVASGRVA
jgi:hypothetical protein